LQPLSLPFTLRQNGILSQNLGSLGLFAPTSAYGEQATGGAIQPSRQGWIIFGVPWYWYIFAGLIAWFVVREGQKMMRMHTRRAAFRNF